MKLVSSARSALLLVGALALIFVLSPGSVARSASTPSQATISPPPGADDLLAEARKAAVLEMRHLPPDAKEVDCAPGMKTAPPYTRPSRGLGRLQQFILSDGRCFEWEGPDPREIIEVITPPGD